MLAKASVFCRLIITSLCLLSTVLASELSVAAQGPTLTVGVYQNAPKIYRDKNAEVVGFWPGLVNVIAKRHAWDIRYVDCQWQQCLEMLENGQLDLMPDVALTEEREKKYNFSTVTALESWSRVYIRKSDRLRSILDLDGRRIAVVEGSSQARQISKEVKGYGIHPNFVKMDNFAAAFDAVKQGRADAVISNALYGSQQKDHFQLKESSLVLYPAELRFAAGKHLDKQYLRQLDETLSELKAESDLVYQELYESLFKPGEKIIAPALSLTKSERLWLSEHPSIDIATNSNWPPMDYVDTDGTARGIGVDVIKILNERLGGVLNVVPGKWNDIYDGVKSKNIDALMDITPRPDRQEFFNFTSPYATIPHVIFSRYNEPYRSSIEELQGHSVALEKGFFIVKELRLRYPDIEIQEYESTEQALRAVSEGRATAYIGNRAVAIYLLEKFFFSNLRAFGEIDITQSINAIGVRKDWPILRDILEKALANLTQSELRHVLGDWVEINPTRVAFDKLRLSKKEQRWLAKARKIRIAFDENYAPYSFRNGRGKFIGVAPDYIAYLQSMLGLDVEIVSGLTWNEMLDALKTKQLDLVATVVKNSERESYLAFTSAYLPTPLVITVRDDDEDTKTADDLQGKRVALVIGYSSSKQVVADYPTIKPLWLNTVSDTLLAVADGRADATVAVLGVSDYRAKESGLTNLKIVGVYKGSKNAQRIAVRNDWPELASILSKALSYMDAKKVRTILDTWLPIDIKGLEREEETLLSFTEEEKDWLRDNPVLRVGADSSWLPVEAVNSQGEFEGIAIDNINRIAELLGLELEMLSPRPWSELIEAAKNGRLDVLSAVTETPERLAYLDFTKAFANFPIVLVVRDETPLIEDLSELKGKKVVVVKSYASNEYLKNNYPDINLQPQDSVGQSLLQVSEGGAFAFAGSLASVSYEVAKLGADNLKVGGQTPYVYRLSLAVPKGNPMLLTLLEKALAAISEKERSKMAGKWFSVSYEPEVNYRYFWQAVLVSLLILFVVIMWNRRLQHEITRRIDTELALVKAKEQADLANAAKSQFLETMSHEIRTPLNGVIGMSELLKTTPLLDHQKNYVDIILSSGRILLNVINDILDFSKLEAGQVTLEDIKFKLDDLIVETASVFFLSAREKGLSFLVSIAPEVPSNLGGDEQHLRQVITNLLSNAFKFTDSGGISLRVSLAENKSDLDHCCVRVEVQDSGIGLTEEQRLRLFQPFEQASSSISRKFGGTGLGLSISKRFVTLMKGQVGIKSEAGKGSCFWFEIPFRSVSDSSGIAYFHGEQVITVEKDESRQAIVVEQLKALGLSVIACSSIDEMLASIEQSGVSPSYVLCGFDITKISILDCLDQNGNEACVRIVLLDSAELENQQSCLSSGYHGAALRPIHKEQMLEILERASDCALVASENTSEGDVEVAGDLESEGHAYSSRALNILVAEDNAVNIQVITGMLKKLGHSATIVTDGQQALEAIQSAHDSYDLILMDCEMPLLNGYEATQQIRSYEQAQSLEALVILALTANVLPESKRRAEDAGMSGFITKPVTIEALKATLVKFT